MSRRLSPCRAADRRADARIRASLANRPANLVIFDPAMVASLPDPARVTISAHGLSQPVEITVAPDGQPLRMVMSRWSNANPQKVWRLQPFGGDLSDVREFEAYRLPRTVDGGNLIGTDAYVPFFKDRVTAIRFADLAR